MTKPSVRGRMFRRCLAGARRHTGAAVDKLQMVLNRPDSGAVYLLIGEVALEMAQVLIQLDRMEKIVREDPDMREASDG